MNARLEVARMQMAPVAIAALGAVGCVVLAVFDPRKQGIYPSCPFRAVTGRACPGCGMTRGLHELLTGHPMAALKLNLLIAVLVPATVYGCVAWALPRWGGPRLPAITLTQRKVVAAIVLMLLFGVVRNLPWDTFRTYSSLT